MKYSLGNCKTWEDVEALLAKTRKELKKDPSDPDLQALKQFGTLLEFSVPDFDFDRDSVQKRMVIWYDENRAYLEASTKLLEQDKIRRFIGFRYVAQNTFGENWSSLSSGYEQAMRDTLLRALPPELAMPVHEALSFPVAGIEDMRSLLSAIATDSKHDKRYPFEKPQRTLDPNMHAKASLVWNILRQDPHQKWSSKRLSKEVPQMGCYTTTLKVVKSMIKAGWASSMR